MVCQQWRRQQQGNALSSVSHNTRTPKSTIPATSQSKSKLNAFKFVGNESNDAQENETQEGERLKVAEDVQDTPEHGKGEMDAAQPDPRDAETKASQSASEIDLPSKTPQLAHANTFPSTPGMRIPLEELIGSFDESTKKVQQPQESPEEHIGWIPNSSSTLLTPNRKRKRARSSSPSCPTTASQRHHPSGSAAQAEKRTPEADPAAALWNQYASNKDQDGHGESRPPDFGHLVFEGSPKALETPAKGAGFRRWASTGNDWPTSRTKKRRTNTRTGINLWQDAEIVESAGRSKVSAMVDRIQESLATQRLASSETKPAVRISAPSSSSPLPEVGALDPPLRPAAASPLQSRQQSKPQRLDVPQATRAPALTTSGDRDGRDNAEGANGDRALDLPGDSFRPTRLHLQSKAPLPAYKRPSITRSASNDGRISQLAPPPAAPAALPPKGDILDADEFGEDFDLSAEDLDELMDGQPPLHQRPLNQIPPHPDPPPARAFDPAQRHEATASGKGQAHQPIVVNDFDDGDDDEFACDDIDEASLAQAEFSATQAFRASHPQSHVASRESM